MKRVTITVIHIDGRTPVKATGMLIAGRETVNVEYRYRGMTYGYEMSATDVQNILNR